MSRKKIKKSKKNHLFLFKFYYNLLQTLFSFSSIGCTSFLFARFGCIQYYFFFYSLKESKSHDKSGIILPHTQKVQSVFITRFFGVVLAPAFYACLLFFAFAKRTPPTLEILKKSMLILGLYDKHHDTVIFSSYSSSRVRWNIRCNSPLYRRENLVVNRLIIVVVL